VHEGRDHLEHISSSDSIILKYIFETREAKFGTVLDYPMADFYEIGKKSPDSIKVENLLNC
jgi:hypothetical protein